MAAGLKEKGKRIWRVTARNLVKVREERRQERGITAEFGKRKTQPRRRFGG